MNNSYTSHSNKTSASSFCCPFKSRLLKKKINRRKKIPHSFHLHTEINELNKKIEVWLFNSNYFAFYYLKRKNTRYWVLKPDIFHCFCALAEVLARILEKQIIYLFFVHSFPRLSFQWHLTPHTTSRGVNKRFNYCQTAWNAIGSRQMFWSREKNYFLTSNNYKKKVFFKNALESF